MNAIANRFLDLGPDFKSSQVQLGLLKLESMYFQNKIYMYAFDCLIHKEWELEKETKVNSEFLLIKSSGIISIFLPESYLII